MTSLHLAAILAVALALAHSVLGERYILIRLFRRDDLPRLFGGPAFTMQTLRFAWHLTTVAWCGLAVLLWQAGSGTLSGHGTLAAIGYTFMLSGLLPLIGTRGRHLAWPVLFLIGGIALWHSAA